MGGSVNLSPQHRIQGALLGKRFPFRDTRCVTCTYFNALVPTVKGVSCRIYGLIFHKGLSLNGIRANNRLYEEYRLLGRQAGCIGPFSAFVSTIKGVYWLVYGYTAFERGFYGVQGTMVSR